eukprot:2824693-Amphidinium_carterae.4
MKPKFELVLPLLHELAKGCAESFGYTSISVNVMRDCSIREHVDYNNLGRSHVFVCGQFEGGAFKQGDSTIDPRDSWFAFWGQWPHSVEHVSGVRISIVYYVPNRIYALRPEHWKRLRDLGFAVDEVLRVSVPKLLSAHAATACSKSSAHGNLCDSLDIAGKYVLVEYACFSDSALSLAFEEKGGVAIRLGLHNVDLSTEEGNTAYKHLIRHIQKWSAGAVV